MALIKEVYNEFFIDKDGCINVRTSTLILEDGKEIARQYHRKVLAPLDDVSLETDLRLKAVAAAVWTQDVKDAYEQKKAEEEPFPIK